jgi:tetratricopeptide (TPR) repeat protein
LDARVFSDRIGRATAARVAGDVAGAARLVRQALDLWRGPAYADVRDITVVTDEARRLDQQRPDAVELCLELELQLGRHAQLLPELAAGVDEFPYHERLRGYQMIALYRSGRQADALEAYRQARIRLRDELGVDPTPELQRLHQQILANDPSLDPPAPPRTTVTTTSSTVVAAQLPADIADFTGRSAELDTLEDSTAGLVVVSGTAGVGKSALVLHWAHRVRGRFPDGQLFANLRGFSATAPLRPIEALGHFLRSLGVASERIPVEVEEAAALYRSLLADRRVLVVLDNAADADQVRPLLPAAQGCRAVVISRNRLLGLVAGESAQSLHLDVLTTDDADALLRRTLGDTRVSSDLLARDELLRLTARLPLALRLAMAHMAAEPDPAIGRYTANLRGSDLLTSFEVPGDHRMAIRTAMRLSYNGLTGPSQRAFRLLGLSPAQSVTEEVAAVMVSGSAAALGELTQASMLEPRPDGRYAFHDLLRRYAAERASAEEPPGEVEAARRRLFEHYLDRSTAAADQLYPHVVRLPSTGGPRSRFDHPTDALSWLDGERENLVVMIQHVADNGPYDMAWRMTDALRGYFSARLLSVDWLVAAEAARRAARLADDTLGQAAAEISLQHLDHRRSEFVPSQRHGEAALAHAMAAGWREGQIAALGNLGNTYRLAGDLDRAVEAYEKVLALAQESGLKAVAAMSLGNLAAIDAQRGRLTATLERIKVSVELAEELGNIPLLANGNSGLGETYRLLGDADKARMHLRQALAAGATLDRGASAEAMRVLALVEADAGNLDTALATATESLRIMRDSGQRPYEADTLAALSDVLHRRGETVKAVETAEQAVALARSLDGRTQVNALVALARALGTAGQLDRALADANRACEIAVIDGLRVLEGVGRLTRAEIHTLRGDAEMARQDATAALEIHRETGHVPGERSALALLARMASAAGAASGPRAARSG